MKLKEQLCITSMDNHIQKQLEPNDILIMGKHKRDYKLLGWMEKSAQLTGKEIDALQEENNTKQDEYLKTKGIN
jgi:hypothetical protein